MSYIEVKEGVTYYAEATINRPAMIVDGTKEEQPPLTVGGTFIVADGDIRLKLVRFDEFFHVDERHLVARIEKNWIASLYDIVPGGSGDIRAEGSSARYQQLLVNTALIGWESWTPECRVRRSHFRVPGADYLLRHYAAFGEVANNKIGDAPEHEVLDVAVSGGQIRVYYNVNGDMNSEFPKDVWPQVEMEFDHGLTVEEMRRRVIIFLRFLSCSGGQLLRASEQTISRLTHQQWLEALEERSNPRDFSVYYFHGKRNPDASQSRVHGAFALLNDDLERTAFVACLQQWFSRDAEWEGATSSMMDAFALDDVMSPVRLLNATKWIEATPGTKSEQVMDEGHVLALSSLISREAIRLGYDKILGRLKNSVRQITKEQNSARFARLVAELKADFGPGVVGDDLAAWVAEAFTLRGKVAHHPLIRQTDAEYELFSKAVHAAECFAYLLLIRGLPMTEKGRKRAASSPMVEYYRIEIKGQLPKDYKAKSKGKL